ncbi:GntR family transcriptional regulator [Pseudalkalibacillus decolorationis]|uniref:GntR family transcriptional regulator n=1 Tax=Pseudalkalibacillus decolorationis TaxID=163879 RepID=UPI00214769E8|nr:GntR family transcriptional regulator [Pseudalkalibacillus decolorationis]
MGNDYESSRPIYLQLVDKMSFRMIRGDLKPGDKLPSVRDMAVDSGVNPNTIQRVYAELERMDIAEVKRGQGTFVTQDEEKLLQLREELKQRQIQSFMKEMNDMGFTLDEIINGIKLEFDNEKGRD